MDDQPTQRLDPEDLPEEEVATPPVRRAARRKRRPVLSTAQCAKCGSRDAPVKVELVAERLVTARRLDVLIGIFGGSSTVRAQTCPNCGHIELYVSDLNRLLS
jgi:predicted nucleic-acid-binding Zn-ribbon protein